MLVALESDQVCLCETIVREAQQGRQGEKFVEMWGGQGARGKGGDGGIPRNWRDGHDDPLISEQLRATVVRHLQYDVEVLSCIHLYASQHLTSNKREIRQRGRGERST